MNKNTSRSSSEYRDPATFAPDINEIKSDNYRFLHTRHCAGQRIEPHGHSRTTATLALRSEFKEVVDKDIHRLVPLDLVFKPPDVVHANSYPDGAECFVIEFSKSSEALLSELEICLRNDIWVGSGSPSAAAIRLYHLLFISRHVDNLALDEAIVLFVTAFSQSFKRHTPTLSPPWISTIRDRLRDCPENAPSLAALAKLADVHPAHLCRTFRAVCGITIGEYARRIRIDEAVNMISASKESLAGIAIRLGYVDQAHFTRDFRLFTGMPPGYFRKIVESNC